MPQGVGYPPQQMPGAMPAQAEQPQQGGMSALDQILMMLFGSDPQVKQGRGIDDHMRDMRGPKPQGPSQDEEFQRLLRQQEQGAAKGALGSLGR